MRIFTKSNLRKISAISFLLTLVVGWLGAQRSMIAYGPPEMMKNNPDPFDAGKLILSALILFAISLISLILSFFKKE